MEKNIITVNGMPYEGSKKLTENEKKIYEAAEALRGAMDLYKSPSAVLKPARDGGFLEEYRLLLHEASKNISLYLEYSDVFGSLIDGKIEMDGFVSFRVDDFIIFEEQLKQDRKDLAVKIADFFIALGNDEIKSYSSLLALYPVTHFNEREGSPWAQLYERFGGNQGNAWARQYQLFGIDAGKARRAYTVIRELSDSALERIVSDESFELPKEKIEALRELMAKKAIGPGTKKYCELHDYFKESTTNTLLAGNVLDVSDGNDFSEEKVRELAKKKSTQLTNTAYSLGQRESMAATESEFAGIITYMYDNNIPLTDSTLNGFVRDYLVGVFEFPEELASFQRRDGEASRVHSGENRIPIIGRNKERNLAPYQDFHRMRYDIRRRK